MCVHSSNQQQGTEAKQFNIAQMLPIDLGGQQAANQIVWDVTGSSRT